MSSSPERPDVLAGKLHRWTIPVVLLLVDALALAVCFWGSPWADSTEVGLIVFGFSTVPLVLLGLLVIRIARHGGRTDEELEVLKSEVNALPRRAKVIQERMGKARREIEAASGLQTYRPVASASRARSNPVDEAEEYVTRRFVASEKFQLDGLEQFLGERFLDKVESLQRYHELAFGIGLAGTVLGLGVQVFLAQRLSRSGILSQTFLTGVILKASCTFVGILVASYARSLRTRLLESCDLVASGIAGFVSYYLAPLFVDRYSNQGQGAGSESVPGVEGLVRDLANELKGVLEKAVNRASEQLKTFAATDLAEAISTKITDPFCAEFRELNRAVHDARQAIEQGTGALQDSAEQVKREVTTAMSSSSDLNEALRETCHTVVAVASSFEVISQQVKDAAQVLGLYRGELEYSIEQARSGNGLPRNHKVVGEEQVRLAYAQLEVLQQQERSLSEISRLIDRLNDNRRV